ncbi:MAG: TonB-dependent receptor [Bacteroidetes bacterium HGW-Bacteroidetes-1]|jgi:iron complex outermembrane receptor protein|nr:MAG: TonB-dependent receptor [Bacteroidetes bacterium HGW-Bacteroidetes-1]
MKKCIILLMMVIIVPVLLQAQYVLKGKIIEQESSLPLPGGHLQLNSSFLKQYSDAEGSFGFGKIKEGVYQLTISYLGFETQIQEINLYSDTFMVIKMKASPYLYDEVVVHSTRVQPKSPLTYSIVNRETLNKENTGFDLPYLLQSTPSVVVTSDAGAGVGYTGLRIRGTDLTRINVTMNGVPINDAESHGVFFVDLPDLASSVENIQIQRGVGTSANGAAAFGASINILTESRSSEAFGAVSSAIGTFQTYKNTLSFGTGISKDGFSLDGRLSKISSDGFIDRGWSDLKSYYLTGSWSNKKTLIKIISTSGLQSTYQAWYGIPKDSLQKNRTYNPAGEMLDSNGVLLGYYDNQTDNYKQDYYQLHIAHQQAEDITITGSAFLTNGNGYYESWKNDQKFSNYGFQNVQLGDIFIKRTDLIQQKWLDNTFYGFQSALLIKKPKHQTALGGGWNTYKGYHFGYISWARFASESLNNSSWYDNTGKKTDYHLYLKSNYKLNEKINLFVDLQWRKIDYSIEGTHDDLQNLDQQHFFNFFNPKFGLFYSLPKGQSAYASVAFSNREPNRSVYRDADPGQIIKHEKLTDFEAGYKFESSTWMFESNLFFMDYQNQLVLTGKINNVGAAIMTNVPSSYRTGWETSMALRISPKLIFNGHFTLSRNKIKNFTEYVDNWNYWDAPETEPYQYVFELGETDISFSPAVMGSGSLVWKVSEFVDVAYQSSFVGRQYLDNTSNTERSLNPYHVGNIRLNLQIPQRLFKTASFQFNLSNIFNTQYETNGWVYRYYYNNEAQLMDGYFPQAGFHWMMQLNLRF